MRVELRNVKKQPIKERSIFSVIFKILIYISICKNTFTTTTTTTPQIKGKSALQDKSEILHTRMSKEILQKPLNQMTREGISKLRPLGPGQPAAVLLGLTSPFHSHAVCACVSSTKQIWAVPAETIQPPPKPTIFTISLFKEKFRSVHLLCAKIPKCANWDSEVQFPDFVLLTF